MTDIVGQTNTAIATLPIEDARDAMLTLAGTIDDANNATDPETGEHLCPFGNNPGPSSAPDPE